MKYEHKTRSCQVEKKIYLLSNESTLERMKLVFPFSAEGRNLSADSYKIDIWLSDDVNT